MPPEEARMIAELTEKVLVGLARSVTADNENYSAVILTVAEARLVLQQFQALALLRVSQEGLQREIAGIRVPTRYNHKHAWVDSNIVIDTYPETYHRSCECGLVQERCADEKEWRDDLDATLLSYRARIMRTMLAQTLDQTPPQP